jgi:hypothetical protein
MLLLWQQQSSQCIKEGSMANAAHLHQLEGIASAS